MLADWARPLWCMTTYGDEDQILASPLQNMRTNLFRMDPQFRLKTNKQKQVKLILCVDKKRAGRRTCESWSSVSEPGPLGCSPSLLCVLIGHKCSGLVFGCLASFLLMLNVTWAWSLGSEMVLRKSHIGGRCIVSCPDLNVKVRFICYKSPFLLSWEELRLAWQQWRRRALHETKCNKMLNEWWRPQVDKLLNISVLK